MEGFIADSPGFSSLEFNDITNSELGNYYPEFVAIKHLCKYRTCVHYHETDCEVKRLVDDGKIDQKRYDYYIKFLNELSN